MGEWEAETPVEALLREEELIDAETVRNRHIQHLEERPTRLVCIGGGTGLPTVLRGLARKALPGPLGILQRLGAMQ